MELSTCLVNRRSVRKYTDEPLTQREISAILEAGLLAPSSRNRKSAEFIVVVNKKHLEILSAAKAAGGRMLKDAAAAIVVIGNSALSDAWIEDCSIAMTNMMLKATELGLGNCWVQCRNRYSDIDTANGKKSADENVRELLHIPEGYSTLAMLSLGRSAEFPEPVNTENLEFHKIHYGTF